MLPRLASDGMRALRLPDNRVPDDAVEVLEYKVIYSEFSRARIQSGVSGLAHVEKFGHCRSSELIMIVSHPRQWLPPLSWRDLQVHWRVLLVLPGRSGAKVNWPQNGNSSSIGD